MCVVKLMLELNFNTFLEVIENIETNASKTAK